MQKLSESELSIMIKIWDEDRPLYLEEIADLLEEFSWAISTVRNFLTRIIDKGYLRVEKDGRKNIYIPIISKEYINKEGKRIIKDLYGNSLKRFVAELYEADYIGHGDLLELKDYLDKKVKEEAQGAKEEKKELQKTIEDEPAQIIDKKERITDQKQADEKTKDKVVLKRLNNIL